MIILSKYKKNYKLHDFNDIINNVLNRVPNFDVVFIDEAQDLITITMEVVR